MSIKMHLKSYRGASMVRATHLTDATALPFDPRALFIILFYLIREEGIKDLVHQLGGGRLRRSLAVLLYLRWVTNGLSSGCSPVNRTKLVITERFWF